MKNDAARRDLSIGTKISPKDLNAKKLQSLLGRSSDGQNIFFENLERTNLCEKRKTSIFALHIGDPHIRVAPKLEFWGPPLFFDTNRFASFGFYCGPPIGRGPRVVVQASLLQNIHQGRRNGLSACQIAEAMLRNLINS